MAAGTDPGHRLDDPVPGSGHITGSTATSRNDSDARQRHHDHHERRSRKRPGDRVIIFDTTLRDGEQSPGARMNLDGEAGDRPVARGAGRRRDRGRLPDRLATAISRPCARSPPRSRRRRLRPRPRQPQGHRPGLGSAAARPQRPRIHTFICHRPAPHGAQAADGAASGASRRPSTASPTPASYCDDVEFGPRTPRAPSRISSADVRRGRHRGRRHARSTSPTPSAMPCPTEYADVIRDAAQARAQHRHRRSSPSIATTTWAWPWPTAWPPSRPARARSNAPSTASASGPATPRSKRSSWRCKTRARLLTASTPASRPTQHLPAPAGWSRRSPACRAAQQGDRRRATPSPTRRASTRTAC